MVYRPAFCSIAFALVGCVAPPLSPPGPSHPASPAAAEAPSLPESMTLTPAKGLPVEAQAAPSIGATTTGVNGSETGAPAAPKRTGSYGCPMHPDVHESNPGRCRKCGMTLVALTQERPASGGGHAH